MKMKLQTFTLVVILLMAVPAFGSITAGNVRPLATLPNITTTDVLPALPPGTPAPAEPKGAASRPARASAEVREALRSDWSGRSLCCSVTSRSCWHSIRPKAHART